MDWKLRELQNVQEQVQNYYPAGSAWQAHINEAEFDFALNDREDCQAVDGIAIDLHGDNLADLFIYNYKGYAHELVLYSEDLDNYLTRGHANYSPSDLEATCKDQHPFSVSTFPFRGQLWPDSMGRISAVMMAPLDFTEDAMVDLFKNLDDVSVFILYPRQEDLHRNLSPQEIQVVEKRGHYLPASISDYIDSAEQTDSSLEFYLSSYRTKKCDWPPCGDVVWTQDQFYAGKNVFGETIIADASIDPLEMYATPLILGIGATSLLLSEEAPAGGDLLSTSRDFFAGSSLDFSMLAEEENFAQMFLGNRRFQSVYYGESDSVAHLDMVVTPLEETVGGKPVLIVAEGTPKRLGSPYYTDRTELDKLAETFTDDFHVERIPYLYVGSKDKIFSQDQEAQALSYNNVLIERYQDAQGQWVKRVYMPWYDISQPQYNEEAKAVYEKYGYEVIPIRGLEEAGIASGALRCLVKVVERDHLPENWPEVSEEVP